MLIYYRVTDSGGTERGILVSKDLLEGKGENGKTVGRR